VFKLALTGGTWQETVLYTFDSAGNGSYASLVRDAAGNLYVTNAFGGPASSGEAFEVQPWRLRAGAALPHR
jgi:hypothetical protein